MISVQIPDPYNLPDAVLTAKGALASSQMPTVDNIAWLVGQLGVDVKQEINTGRTVLSMAGVADTPANQSALRGLVLDMALRMRIKAESAVLDRLEIIAQQNPYHPMEVWLGDLVWDGADHIGALIDTVKSPNALWPVYLRKWLIQTCEAVCGWRDTHERSIPYVLTFTGAQGAGKTSWFKKLGGSMGWMMSEAELHLNSASSKDHQIAVLAKPMAELSELDGIFRKSDISNMKSFISRGVDSIRSPYARTALVKPRMTAFCASVNECEFLNDPTGSRRFWPVEVESVDYRHSVSFEGVWAQAYELWCAGEDFHLTAVEDAIRVNDATTFVQVSSIEEKVVDYLDAHKHYPKEKWRVMNRSAVLDLLFGGRNHSPKDCAEAGRALEKVLGKHRTLDGKQRSWKVPYNISARDISSWPEAKSSLKLAIDNSKP